MAATRWALVALLAAGCAPALADLRPALSATDRGAIWFRTDEPRALSGDLAFPPGTGPFPALVLMHGCSGIIYRHMHAWTETLHSLGYATFVVDSHHVGPAAVRARGRRGVPRLPTLLSRL